MFGEKAYQIIPDIMRLREQLRPYIMKHVRKISSKFVAVLIPPSVNVDENRRRNRHASAEADVLRLPRSAGQLRG